MQAAWRVPARRGAAGCLPASVGNLPPGKEALLKITYVSELTSRRRAAFPCRRRYRRATRRAATGRPRPSGRRNPEPAARLAVPYGLNSHGEGDDPRRPQPNRVAVASDRDDGERTQATVTLSQQEVALDRDFVLSVAARDSTCRAPGSSATATERPGAAVAIVLPRWRVPGCRPKSSCRRRSGSMPGASIEQVRNALQLLPPLDVPGCRFNIVGFGIEFESLFPESSCLRRDQPGCGQRLRRRFRRQRGHEDLPALKSCSRAPAACRLTPDVWCSPMARSPTRTPCWRWPPSTCSTRPRLLVRHRAGASHHLVRGLARAGRGAAEFIYPGERIETKVVRLFGRLLSPV